MQQGQPMQMQQGIPQGGQPQQMMQPGPGMIMQNAQGQQFVMQQVDNRTGFQKLNEISGVFVKQKLDILEALSGCELPNKYYIYALNDAGAGHIDANGKKKKSYYSNAMGGALFKAKECSGCLERQFCRGEARPLAIELNHESPNSQNHKQPFLRLDKPCKCVTPCCCRPELVVTMVENGSNQRIGRIMLPCQCVSPTMHVFLGASEEQEAMAYTIKADCMQCGLCCPQYPCEACQTVTFEITTSGNPQPIGVLEKRTKGCIAAMVSDADNFLCSFPAEASTQESRALLMSAILFVDFMMFEDTKQDKNGGLGRGGLAHL